MKSRLSVVCLSVYPSEGPSTRHRILAYAKAWSEAGIALDLQPFLTHGLYRNRRRFGPLWSLYKAIQFAFCTLRLMVRLTLLARYDVVVIHREAFPLGGPWFERLATRINPATVFDLDDAIWLPMPLAVNQRALFWDSERVARIMGQCAAVVAGNAFLADYARRHNRFVHVIPTPYADLGGGVGGQRATDPPIVVWIGNVGNEEYLDMVRTPLARLAREVPFVLRVIGSAEATAFRMEGVNVQTVLWSEERERDWLLESAIGIMPLADRDYERGKCSFKLIQYFSAGLPVVASPVGMNAEVVRHGDNGFLAQGEEQWYEYLKRLLCDKSLREAMGASGYATFQRDFTRTRNALRWLEVFASIRVQRAD